MAEVKLKCDEAETVTVGLAEFKNITDGHDSRRQTGRRGRLSLAAGAARIQATGVGDGKRLRKHGEKAGKELKAKGN